VVSFHRRGELRGKQRENDQKGFPELLIAISNPESPNSEAFRILRTHIFYSFVEDPPKVIVLTSASIGEGKSTVCANLGVVLAQAGKSVLIADCDFRRPVMHELFGLSNLQGMADILVGQQSPQEVWREPVAGLKVVTVGPMLPNPSEVLGTSRFSEFLASIRDEFDYVLIDAPPVGLVSDPAVLAVQGDGVILVVDAQKTRKVAVRRAVRSLQAVGGSILGTVMNNVKVSPPEYRYDYKYRRKPE
jgi:capsular exopolysaccharide synthesis family protein